MKVSCGDKERVFKTSEASTKSWFRVNGLIDKYLNILNLPEFRKQNTKWSNHAIQQNGIAEGKKLFLEENNGTKATPNKEVFKQIDESKGIYYQQTPATTQSPIQDLEKQLTNFLTKQGVTIKQLNSIKDNEGNELDVIARSNIVQKIVEVVQGRADVTTLPEEAAHFFVELLGDNHPLVKSMMRDITSKQIYTDTYNEYNEVYNGDVEKIKKEAVGKLIALNIVKQFQGKDLDSKYSSDVNSSKFWFKKVWDMIKSYLKNFNTDRLNALNKAVDSYSEAAGMILSGEEIESTAEKQLIKKGVDELFNSNPELANKVYEALGFTNKINSDIKINEIEDTDSYKEIEILYKGLSIGKATLIKSEDSDTVDYIEDWNIKGEYQNKGLGYSARQLMQNKYPTLRLSDSATDKSKYLYDKSVRNQITPQQKQQALQAYSQYLDTIFPNSKVKDIVYHFSNAKIEIPDKKKFSISANINRRKGFFGINKNINPGNNYANIEGTIPHAMLFDMQNSDKGDFSVLPPIVAKDTTKDSAIIKQRGDIVYLVVFNPEQIHILSSKKDLEMFRNFINFTKSEYAKYGDIQQFRDYIMSKNFAAVEEFLVVNNKIDREC